MSWGCQLKPEGPQAKNVRDRSRMENGTRMSGKLTPRRKLILDCIRAYIQKNHFSPTLREIMEASGIKSSDTMWNHLSQLEYGGYITRKKNGIRTIQVVDQPSESEAALKRVCDGLLDEGWAISFEDLSALLERAGARVVPL